jgi:hypothetical protein
MISRIWNRIANEPALIGGLVLAVGNLIGEDFSGEAAFVESGVALVVAWLIRRKVTPVRKLRSVQAPPEAVG